MQLAFCVTNILWAAFLYNSVLCSFSVLTVCVRISSKMKCAKKLLIKCWWNKLLVYYLNDFFQLRFMIDRRLRMRSHFKQSERYFYGRDQLQLKKARRQVPFIITRWVYRNFTTRRCWNKCRTLIKYVLM